MAGKFLRQSLGRTVFGLESFESIPETSRTMRFESHFKSYFGNVKAFNLKKIKIIAAIGALRRNGRRRPCVWGATAAKFPRQSLGLWT